MIIEQQDKAEEEFETIKIIKPIIKSKESSKRFLWSKHPNQEIAILGIIERQFKDKVNAKSVPTVIWENISNVARVELSNFSELEAITSTSVKSLFRGLKLSFQNFKEGKTKTGKKPRHYDLLQSIIICDKQEDPSPSFSLSASPELKSIGSNIGKVSLQQKTPSLNGVARMKVSTNILQIANAAQPTPVLGGIGLKSSSSFIIPNASKKKLSVCLLCGMKPNKDAADSHYSSCLDNVEHPAIISALEKCDRCYFCKMDWISSYVSASYRIKHMKECCSSTTSNNSSLSMIMKYLVSLKTDGLPETPLIDDESVSRGGVLSRAFEFLKPAPRIKEVKKKNSPSKNTLVVTDDSILISRRAVVLNPVSINGGSATKLAPASFHQSIRIMDGDKSSTEGKVSLFSMGNGAVSIKKKINAVKSINPDSSSQPNMHSSQNSHSQPSPKRTYDEFDMDKSHLLEKALSKRELDMLSPPKNLSLNPSLEILSGMEQMEDLTTGNHSFLVVSPKRQRTEETSYQFLSCSQVSNALLDIDEDKDKGDRLVPLKRIPILSFSSIQSVSISPVAINRIEKNLDFSITRCFEYEPVIAETIDSSVQAALAGKDAGNQTDENAVLSNVVDAAAQTEEWEDDIPNDLPSSSGISLCAPQFAKSEKVCLQLSEAETHGDTSSDCNEKHIDISSVGSERDLFTPDGFHDSDYAIPSFAVSQDISRLYDENISTDGLALNSQIEDGLDLELMKNSLGSSPRQRQVQCCQDGKLFDNEQADKVEVIVLSDNEAEVSGGLHHLENLPATPGEKETDSSIIEYISEDLHVMNQSQSSVASTIIECTQHVSAVSPGFSLFGQMAKKKAKGKHKRKASPKADFVPVMPNYAAMSLNELQLLGQGFGLKANGRKLLVAKLIEIWSARNDFPSQPIVSAQTTAGPSTVLPSFSTVAAGPSILSKDALKAAIRADKDLYQKILCYEPINLDEVMASLSTRLALPVSRKILMDFFDEQGINASARKD